MISYLNYIKMLNEKHIVLYDHQIRISHYKLNNLFNNKQVGGGINEKNLNFNNMKDFQIEKIIFKLLNNEDINAIEMINKLN
jgi:hypothetical protein